MIPDQSAALITDNLPDGKILVIVLCAALPAKDVWAGINQRFGTDF